MFCKVDVYEYIVVTYRMSLICEISITWFLWSFSGEIDYKVVEILFVINGG